MKDNVFNLVQITFQYICDIKKTCLTIKVCTFSDLALCIKTNKCAHPEYMHYACVTNKCAHPEHLQYACVTNICAHPEYLSRILALCLCDRHLCTSGILALCLYDRHLCMLYGCVTNKCAHPENLLYGVTANVHVQNTCFMPV